VAQAGQRLLSFDKSSGPPDRKPWWCRLVVRAVPSAVNAPLTVPTACSAIARRKEEMGMDMDEIRMILAVRALRKLLNKGERGDGGELVATYRALGEAIVENKPMTRKNRARVAEYLREAGAAA
jgi:hypothetical protein